MDIPMDLDSIEGLDEVRPAVYRAVLKLRYLQKIYHLNVVTLRELLPALRSTDEERNQGVELSREEVMQGINRMFKNVSRDGSGQVTADTSEHTCSLLFKLYDREQGGVVSSMSVEVALTALSGDTLSVKNQALAGLAEKYSCSERGTVSRSGLRALLQDLSQVPTAVQEGSVFGSVEGAVRSCFSGVLDASVSKDHVISWLQTGPLLLLWLSTLYRLSVSENVTHTVRCHACKAYPITGLRYRCMKCVNLHLCQTCFLTERPSKKHKNSHPVLEHCTQPSWKESLASLASSARHILLPRRFNRSKAERRALGTVTCQELQASDLPHDSSSMAQYAISCANQSPHTASHRASPHPLTPRLVPNTSQSPAVSLHSKALQTEDSSPPPPQNRASVLLKDVRDLQRDKWLLEQELQVWRTAVQTEQGTLEDRCCEMEANMETLRQHNLRLQDMLTQALIKTDETHQDTDVTPQGAPGPERDSVSVVESFSSGWTGNQEGQEEEENDEEEDVEDRRDDECEEEESVRELVLDKDKEEDRREEDGKEDVCNDDDDDDDDDDDGGRGRAELESNTEMYSATIHWGMHFEEQEPVEDILSGALGETRWAGELDSGTCSFEELEEQLCEVVRRLQSALSDQASTDTGCELERGSLVDAAEEVGDAVHQLVSAIGPEPHSGDIKAANTITGWGLEHLHSNQHTGIVCHAVKAANC